MISALFFIWFFVAFLWTVNALRRPTLPGEGLAPLWFPGMIVSELAAWLFLSRAAVAVAFLMFGGADLAIGKGGLVLFMLSEVGLLVVIYRAAVAARYLGFPVSVSGLLRVWDRTPSWELVEHDIPYAKGLTLNVHRQIDTRGAPTMLYLHPGSWMRGRPGRQARPLVHALVASGWIVLDAGYPLSPKATFPEHLVGVKRAIAWAKEGGSNFGVDPERIVVSGGSAGAHLAALAALTPHMTELQPGFEQADVSVVGCLPFYGIFDLLNRNNTRYDWPFIAKHVMKARPEDDPDRYRLGSPLDMAANNGAPFHIVHGEFDSVVLPAESMYLAEALRGAGSNVTYTEVRTAQHGFDGLSGLRAKAIAARCADWLNDLVDAR